MFDDDNNMDVSMESSQSSLMDTFEFDETSNERFDRLFNFKNDALFEYLRKIAAKNNLGKFYVLWRNPKKPKSQAFVRDYYRSFKVVHNDFLHHIKADFSHGLDYHDYILQDLYIYERNKYNIEVNEDFDLHNSCLESRLPDHIISRMQKEFCDFILNKSCSSPSIYKKFGRDYNIGPVTTFYYEDFTKEDTTDSEDEDSTEEIPTVHYLVVNGKDINSMLTLIFKITEQLKVFPKRVFTNRHSVFEALDFMDNLLRNFDKSYELLWLDFMLDREYLGVRKEFVSKWLNSCTDISRDLLEYLNNFTEGFHNFLSTLPIEEAERLYSQFVYQLGMCFTLILPTIMGINCLFSNVLPIDSYRTLILSLKQICLEKFLNDHFEFASFRY